MHFFLRNLNNVGKMGNSLVVQWSGLLTSSAGGMGSIPGGGTKIPHAMVQPKKKKCGESVSVKIISENQISVYLYIYINSK